MESDALKTWLRKKAFRDAAASVFLALLAAMAGVVVLVVTFLFSYAVVWFGFNLGVSGVSQLLFDRPLHIGHPLILLVCSVFLVLLFIGNARTRREYLGTLLKSDCPRFVPQTGVFGALGFLLANAAVSSTMVADLLFSGPRLMGAAGGALGKAGRLMFLDVGGCSQVLATLLSRDSHCSFHELSQLSGVSDPIAVFRQMRDIGGIVFLDAGQTGLSLTRELRGELLAVTGNVALGPGASEN